ncbi:EcoKI restriction-modification system protein HsdS [Fructobacillus sp. EFB-N1]|nr:EcoKI restriction-modification system protein HsdS [Fructobacillus sp. EFB-N1]
MRISNILSNGRIGGQFAYYPKNENDSNYVLPNKSTVIAMSGATTGKVAILFKPDNTKVYQNQRVGYFQRNELINYGFVSILVTTPHFKNLLNSTLVTGAQPNISPKDVNDFEFEIPILINEQEKIGTVFSKIDNLITLHQRRPYFLVNLT